MAQLKVLMVLMLVAVMLIPESDAWFGGRRRRRFSCGCDWFGCHCGGKKRDAPEALQDTESEETEMKYIPNKFSVYDINRDSKITIVEFFRALRMKDGSAMPFFKQMDTNGDQVISCDEFKTAKDLPFEKKPEC